MGIDELFGEGITETIVTTISSDGIPNAAPMGVVRKDSRLFIRMFPGTRTLMNVKETGLITVNFVKDPEIFVISAFQDLGLSEFKLEEGFSVPHLKNAMAWVNFKCNAGAVVELEPLGIKIIERKVPAFSRAFASVIEATIVGTRLHLYKNNEGQKKILEYDAIVKKCGGPVEIAAMKKLKEILCIGQEDQG
jgi:hypothetical protein